MTIPSVPEIIVAGILFLALIAMALGIYFHKDK